MEAQKMGLIINNDKTKYIKTGKWTKEKYIRINNTDIEKVNQFKHLGSMITNNNSTSEINYIINMGNKCYYGQKYTDIKAATKIYKM
jgi:hypothetical protein